MLLCTNIKYNMLTLLAGGMVRDGVSTAHITGTGVLSEKLVMVGRQQYAFYVF
jgi:hypothetical protein